MICGCALDGVLGPGHVSQGAVEGRRRRRMMMRIIRRCEIVVRRAMVWPVECGTRTDAHSSRIARRPQR